MTGIHEPKVGPIEPVRSGPASRRAAAVRRTLLKKPTFEIIKLLLHWPCFHFKFYLRWFENNTIGIKMFYPLIFNHLKCKMKTKLIAIGNIIVIIFFMSRIRIKMHFKFFLINFTMKYRLRGTYAAPTRLSTCAKFDLRNGWIQTLFLWILKSLD